MFFHTLRDMFLNTVNACVQQCTRESLSCHCNTDVQLAYKPPNAHSEPRSCSTFQGCKTMSTAPAGVLDDGPPHSVDPILLFLRGAPRYIITCHAHRSSFEPLLGDVSMCHQRGVQKLPERNAGMCPVETKQRSSRQQLSIQPSHPPAMPTRQTAS